MVQLRCRSRRSHIAQGTETRTTDLRSALATYYDFVRDPALTSKLRPKGPSEPTYELPPLDDRLEGFFEASAIGVAELESYRGRTLKVLDLRRNPRTRTTKTFASLVIVARAIHHIRESGRPLLILTPTSGNKGTALRDAVLRALEHGLVAAEELHVATVVPAGSRAKLWASALAEDEALRAANPVLLYGGADPEQVKAIARTIADRLDEECSGEFTIWHTLELDNYRQADAMRAAFEADSFPPEARSPRVHAHAVSSAYGLLGYELGFRAIAEANGGPELHSHPQFLIVQHLGAPDMVLSLRHGSFSGENVPSYELDAESGLYVQDGDPTFPQATFDAHENLDSTFYTHRPPTSALFDPIVHRHGGTGIVVSLYECVRRYADVRRRLGAADIALPADPRALREWALVMVMTGVLNGIDRGLVAEDADVVVHATGSYGTDDFTPLSVAHATQIRDEREAFEAIGALR